MFHEKMNTQTHTLENGKKCELGTSQAGTLKRWSKIGASCAVGSSTKVQGLS